MQAIGKPLALLCVFVFLAGCVIIWQHIRSSRGDGAWKHGLELGVAMVLVPTFMGILAFMFWGQIGPVLNWG